MNPLHREVLPNGICVLHKQVPHTKIAHCGFVIDIGSRDEKPYQAGLAHFWEHMAFKGTAHRKAFHILNRIDRVGGELNAFTTKEKINFYSSSLDKHFDRAVDILADITFHSTFPDREIQKERSVILEEMSMYEDDAGDAICDEFDYLLFGDHPLGRNILGERATVKQFAKPDFDQFLHENLDTSRVIFVSVSALPTDKAIKVIKKYLSDIPTYSARQDRAAFTDYTPVAKVIKKPISQAHCVIGSIAPGLKDQDRLAFSLLINLLGGPALNSRLNMLLREKHGYVYSIEANYHSYSEVGSSAIQFATEKKHLKRCIQLIHREIKLLQQHRLGVVQLQDLKNQFMGQLAMAEEGNLGLMMSLGKSHLEFGRMESLEELFQKIEKLTSSQLMDACNQYLQLDQLSQLIYEPMDS